jgi:acetolactate synthase regulatory subunit
MFKTATRASQEENLAQVLRAASALQEAIYTMAQTAMHDTNPHNVAWIVAEHDKVNMIVRKLDRLVTEHSL